MAEEILKLKKEIERLKKSIKKQRYGLVWMPMSEAFEDDVENKLPILKEIPELAIKNDDGKPTHILIEGDNYHSLTCLNYTHKGKIDLIYIDPPYNTGSDGFRYKDKRIIDKFPDGTEVPADHPFRHSYWLSFMKKRLELCWDLLSEEGVIFISIDDNELAQLKLLCDEIFEQSSFINIICLKSGRDEGVKMAHKEKRLVKYKEYILLYAKNKQRVRFKPQYKEKKEWDDRYNSWLNKHNSKDCIHWEIYPLSKKLKDIGLDFADEDEVLEWKIKNRDNIVRLAANSSQAIKSTKGKKHIVKLITPRGLKAFAFNGQKLLFASNKIKNVDGDDKLGEYVGDLWDDISYNNLHNEGGVNLKNGKKPVALIKRMLKLTSKPNSVILDFFAGSGTTGHAVMELNNEEEGSKRQFIICTNNEDKICADVCYPRMQNVMLGKHKVQKLGNSLKYYRTAFIGKNSILNATDSDKVELAHNAGELLAIAENTLDFVKQNKYYQLFEDADQKRYTAVYFREELDKFEEFVEMVEKLKKRIVVYVFSWGNEGFSEEFDHIKDVRVKTIPQPILEIYKNIYNLGA